MKLNDRQLQDAYRSSTSRAKTGRADCPSAETLTELRQDTLPDSERTSLLQHLSICSDCLEEYRLGESLETVVSSGKTTAGTWTQHWRLAASITVLAITLSFFWMLHQSNRIDYDPSRMERGREQNDWKIIPPDGGKVPPGAVQLRWSSVPKATGYRVSLYDTDSTQLWTSRVVSTPVVEIPQSVSLESGKHYYWRITIFQGDYQELSRLYEFLIE